MQTDEATEIEGQSDVNAAFNRWVAELLLRHGDVRRSGM
jgi:hypothetical protein